MFKVDSSLKHVGQNVGHQRYLEENYGKRVRVSSKDGYNTNNKTKTKTKTKIWRRTMARGSG